MVNILEVLGQRPVGGVGSFLINYQSHFQGDEVHLDYLMFDDIATGAFDEKVREMGSNVFVLPRVTSMSIVKVIKELDHFFGSSSQKYKAIHLHAANMSFFVLPIARKYNIRYRIVHSHSTVYSDNKMKAFRNMLLCSQLKKQANIYCACSKLAGEFLFGKENIEKVHIFNNAVDIEKFKYNESIRKKTRNSLCLDDSFVIGHVGNFVEVKNHRFLVELFAEVKKKIPYAKLLLVGSGPLEVEIKQYCTALGIQDSVLFLGYRNDVPDLLQAMDVFVLPSLFEGLPVIGIEAQASGLPLIVSDSVTEELGVANVTFLPLNSGKTEWSNELLRIHAQRVDRTYSYNLLKERGFEISDAAKKLESFYSHLS